MKKKKLNKEKITRVLVYVLCFALVGISLFSLFSVFVGATVYDCECSNYNVDGICETCGNCAHYYFTGDSCDNCSFICPHPEWIDSECVVCHTECEQHRFPTDRGVGTCEICGTFVPCSVHVFMDSVCLYCGYTCLHPSTTKYIKSANSEKHIELWVCDDCGEWTFETLFYHSLNSDGICTKCGYGCPHTDTYVVYGYNGDKDTHLRIETCASCGLMVDVTTQEHILVDGACPKCNYVCRHSLAEHCVYTTNPEKHPWETYCVDCGVVTKTVYVDHKFNSSYKCSCCGYVCTHSKTEFKYTAVNDGNEIWYHSRDEVCAYCSYVVDTGMQNHSWSADGDGFCAFCGYVCAHAEYSEGVCVDCGAECPHNRGTYIVYSSVESVETPDYLHWVRFYCVDCDVRVRSDPRDGGQEKCTYLDGVCTVCEHKCSHKRGYNNDTCIRCKMVCDHSVGFENGGECKQCNYVCSHPKSYWHYTVTDKGADDDYHILLKDCTFCKCQISSQSQAHTYNVDFKCTACDRFCKHSTFENIICKHCGFNCPHDSYTNGVCDLCGLACTHRWEKSTCKICALVCENHTFTDGSLRCDTCDYYVVYDGYQQNDGFFKLMTAIFDAQTNTYFSLLGYEILGVNIAYFVLSLVTLALAIVVFKIVKKVM